MALLQAKSTEDRVRIVKKSKKIDIEWTLECAYVRAGIGRGLWTVHSSQEATDSRSVRPLHQVQDQIVEVLRTLNLHSVPFCQGFQGPTLGGGVCQIKGRVRASLRIIARVRVGARDLCQERVRNIAERLKISC